MEYWQTQKLLNNQKIEEAENKLYEECKKIGNRLLGIPQRQINQQTITEDVFLNQEFEETRLNKLGLDILIQKF